MVAANPAGLPAYSNTSINPVTLAQIVDPADGIVASVPVPGLTTPFASAGGYASATTQLLVAILSELRVLNTLIQANSAPSLDLGALRADEAPGSSGGSI